MTAGLDNEYSQKFFGMKTKQSKKAQADLPLPEPMELAKLAAILRPEFGPKEALKTAMEFYVEALLFSRELPSTFEELLTQFGSEERQREITSRPLKKVIEEQWANTLELDLEKNDDPARQYLAEKGLRFKKAQSVLDNFRRYYNALPKDTWMADRRASVQSVIARCEQVTDGRKTYAMPKFMLESVVQHAKSRRKESKRKSWHTRKSREKPAQKTVKKKIQKSYV